MNKKKIYIIIFAVIIILGYLNYFKDESDLSDVKKAIETTNVTYDSEDYHVEADKQVDYVDDNETNFEKDPLFGNTTDSMIYNNAYYGDNDPKLPYISPLYGDYEGLPPMLFQVGGAEMLLSDSVRAAKKAKAAGCEVHLTVYDEMFHVFQLGMKMMKESRNAWKEIEEFLSC